MRFATLLLFYFLIGISKGQQAECELEGVVNKYLPGWSVSLEEGIVQTKYGTAKITDLIPGTLLLVIQMQGAMFSSANNSSYGDSTGIGAGYTNLTETGKYEFVRIKTVQDIEDQEQYKIFLYDSLMHSYLRNEQETQVKSSFQVVTVPECIQGILKDKVSCSEWNGETGGIVAILANSLTMNNHEINCKGSGFRGGGPMYFQVPEETAETDFVTTSSDPPPSLSTNISYLYIHQGNSVKGEGICGTPFITVDKEETVFGMLDSFPKANEHGYPSGDFSRGAPGNAGGGGNEHNAGGGGGGHVGRGGNGAVGANGEQNGGIGGGTIPPNWNSGLFLGGGGGAGNGNNPEEETTTQIPGTGGVGGGIVILITCDIKSGTIDVSGSDGVDAFNDGTGGGGAGGSIVVATYFECRTQFSGDSVIFFAKGGNAGRLNGDDENFQHGGGGGGGGGLVVLPPINLFSNTSVDVKGGICPSPELNNLSGDAGGEGLQSSQESNFQIPTVAAPPSFTPSTTASISGSRTGSRSNRITQSASSSLTSSETKTSSITKSVSLSQTSSASESHTLSSSSSLQISLSNLPSLISSNSLNPSPSSQLPTMIISQTHSQTNLESNRIVNLSNNDNEASELIFSPPTEEALLALEDFTSLSDVINVELIQNGQVVQPREETQICLKVTDSNNNACLSFFNENTNEWECEDPCLEYKGEFACGHTQHFTNFAILLSGGSGNSRECESSEFDWILNSSWQDGVLIASFIVCCFCFCIIIAFMGTIFPKVHGNEYYRVVCIRNANISKRSLIPVGKPKVQPISLQ